MEQQRRLAAAAAVEDEDPAAGRDRRFAADSSVGGEAAAPDQAPGGSAPGPPSLLVDCSSGPRAGGQARGREPAVAVERDFADAAAAAGGCRRWSPIAPST